MNLSFVRVLLICTLIFPNYSWAKKKKSYDGRCFLDKKIDLYKATVTRQLKLSDTIACGPEVLKNNRVITLNWDGEFQVLDDAAKVVSKGKVENISNGLSCSGMNDGSVVVTNSHSLNFFRNDGTKQQISMKREIENGPVITKNGNVVVIEKIDHVVTIFSPQGAIIGTYNPGEKSEPFKDPVINSKGEIVLVDQKGGVTILEESGKIKKQKKAFLNSKLIGNPVLDHSGELVMASSDGQIHFLDSSLDVQHKAKLGNLSTSPVDIGDGLYCVGTSTGNMIILNSKGEIKSTVAVGGNITRPPEALSDGTIAVLNSKNEISYYTREGNLKSKFTPPCDINTELDSSSDGFLIFGCKNKTLNYVKLGNKPTETKKIKTEVSCYDSSEKILKDEFKAQGKGKHPMFGEVPLSPFELEEKRRKVLEDLRRKQEYLDKGGSLTPQGEIPDTSDSKGM